MPAHAHKNGSPSEMEREREPRENPWRGYFRSIPKGKDATACCAPSCIKSMVAKCSWRMHTTRETEDGAKVRQYDGSTCDLRLCVKHRRDVKGKPLCEWHFGKAREEGLA